MNSSDWPCGLMDKVCDFESEDCEFESRQGQLFLCWLLPSSSANV